MRLGVGLGIGFGGAPAAPFVPPNITGLALWYRADLGVTQVANAISGVADQSGAGDPNRNLSQATPANKPTLIPSDATFNNHPSVSHDATGSQELDSGTFASPIAAPYTVYMVGSIASGIGFLGGTANIVEVGFNEPTGLSLYAGAFVQSSVSPGTTPHVWCGKFGPSGAASQDTLTPNATGDTGSSALRDIQIGKDGGGNHFATIKWAEIIVYGRAMTAGEHTTIMNYLGKRYAITIGP